MSLIVLKNGESARSLEPEEFPGESSLQELIAQHPEALPLKDLRSDLQFLVVARELPTASGPIDAVGLDEQGQIYLIETKLFKNPDKRRVLAQVLDYGAALWHQYADPRDLRDELSAAAAKLFDGEGLDLDDRLRSMFELGDEELAELWSNVESSAREGRFRFVVLMDSLDDRLRDLITYINENSRFDVYGVELELYRFDEYQALRPRLHGAEARKEVGATTASRRRWTEDSFFEEVRRRHAPGVVAALETLYEFAKDHADGLSWGTGKINGSFNPRYDELSPRSLYTVYTDAAITFNFKWLGEGDSPQPESVHAIASRLGQLDGWTLPPDYESSFVVIPPEVWTPQVERLIEAIREAHGSREDRTPQPGA